MQRLNVLKKKECRVSPDTTKHVMLYYFCSSRGRSNAALKLSQSIVDIP